MRTLTAFTLLILLALGGLAFQQAQTTPQSYDQLRTQAEKHFEDQSFSLARELYLKAVTLDVNARREALGQFYRKGVKSFRHSKSGGDQGEVSGQTQLK